jgi:hypothetical protein
MERSAASIDTGTDAHGQRHFGGLMAKGETGQEGASRERSRLFQDLLQ